MKASSGALSPHLIEEIKALPARYPQPRSAVMPALDLAQEELGYLTPEAMTEVATALQLDAGYVEGVATFYTLFHLEPIGKHRFYMCTNLSCTLRGAEEMVQHLRGAIGVREAGEVSQDGLFSYEEVECMGACEYAPMCRIDHRYHYDLTTARIDGLISERRGGRIGHLAAGGEVARGATAAVEPASAPRKRRLPSSGPVPAAPAHPPAAPATSPAGGVAKPRRPRKKQADV
ncbi:MAG: NADH-quinone oxidoreductase subunit NuoE [Candidatus Dormibacteraceae bacterium]